LFTNETAILLRDSLSSILLSLVLSISIIVSLIYLLKTIYKQKQLAEVKNDLINNITHEFKTPIATISAALEAMKNFNVLNDKAKSEKYISIAQSQTKKLTTMVEKILETAVLNHEELIIDKQATNIAKIIEQVIEKYKIINQETTFDFKKSIEKIFTIAILIYASLFLIFANDIFGFVMTLLTVFILQFRPRERMMYLTMYIVVAFLEIIGTSYQSWYWPDTAFGLMPFLKSANPPSGISFFYFGLDLGCLWLYKQRHKIAWKRMKHIRFLSVKS